MDRSDTALYIWDYFYIQHVARAGDERPWRLIENATGRMRESVQYLGPGYAQAIQLEQARRLRRDARVALRQIALLSAPPADWVTDGLAALETFAEQVIQGLKDVVTPAALN